VKIHVLVKRMTSLYYLGVGVGFDKIVVLINMQIVENKLFRIRQVKEKESKVKLSP
jgi:hypothetical protein